MPNGKRTGTAYRKLRARVIQEEHQCSICHRPVDKTLRYPHPMSPTLQHDRPLVTGGSLLDRRFVSLAHLRCNSSEGATLGNALRAKRPPTNTSQRW